MLIPKRTKYRKQFRGRMKGKEHRGNTVTYGEYGLVALEPSWITSRQIEAARIAMTRYTKRGGKVWIKIFPDKPVSAKPIGTRQGSGRILGSCSETRPCYVRNGRHPCGSSQGSYAPCRSQAAD